MFLAQTETSTFPLSSYYHLMSCHSYCFVFIYIQMYTTVDLSYLILLFHVFIYIYYCRCIIVWSCFAVFICHRRYTMLDLAVQCVHNVSVMYSKPYLVLHLNFNWVSHLQNRSYVEVLFNKNFGNHICFAFGINSNVWMLKFNIHWKSVIWNWKESWKYYWYRSTCW